MNTKIRDLLSRMSFEDDTWRFPGSISDIFSALHAIALYDKKLLEGRPLAKILTLLVSIEAVPGGPYYSNMPDASGLRQNNVCDRETNEAIDRFLSLYDVNLPNLKEFLGKENSQQTAQSDIPSRIMFNTAEHGVMNQIKDALRTRLASLDPHFRKRAVYAIEKTISGNPDKQMPLMPHYMKAALGKKAENIPEKTITDMGLSNIFFWTAFIIYDDFWDEDEDADPRLLPVANLLARSYVGFYDSLFKEGSKFRIFFHQLMDELDCANGWETTRCRLNRTGTLFEIPETLPQYGDYIRKYRPASGHILGPLGILMLSGYKVDSIEAKHLVAYFKHYLIAMQMNDDMHDWEEDLRRGHISTAVHMLLRDYIAGGSKKTIDIEGDLEALRKVFWFTTLPKIARKALEHTRKSRTALHSMKSVYNRAPLEYFIHSNQKIAEKALSEQKQSVQFLKAYGKFSIPAKITYP